LKLGWGTILYIRRFVKIVLLDRDRSWSKKPQVKRKSTSFSSLNKKTGKRLTSAPLMKSNIITIAKNLSNQSFKRGKKNSTKKLPFYFLVSMTLTIFLKFSI